MQNLRYFQEILKNFSPCMMLFYHNLDVQFVTGDILNPENLPQDGYSHILHAAAESTTGLLLSPLERFDQIVSGTRNVLDMALRSGKPRVLMVSSGGVYGDISEFSGGVREDFCGMANPLDPENAYSVAKRQAEHLCALYLDRHGLESVIARCFAFVGEELPLDAHFAIGNFISDALKGKDIVIKVDGTPIRTFLDQGDLAQWLTTIMLHGDTNKAYNVGSSEAVNLGQAAQIVSELSGKISRVEILGTPTIVQAARRNIYVPCVERARNELGLKVNFSFSNSIQHTLSALSGDLSFL